MASRTLAAVLLLVLASACSGGGEASAGDGAGPPVRASEVRRSEDPRVVRLRDALERGRVDLARTLLDQVGPSLGVERPLLAARVALTGGDAVGALRELEAARRDAPDDPRVYATACELFTALGRSDAAIAEVREGLRRCGRTPEISRAEGVLAISTPGGAEVGLVALEKAVAVDPGLPFAGRALQQARLLVGRKRLAEDRAEEALVLAEGALGYDDTDLDALELLADACSASQRLERALTLYGRLEEAGRDQGDRVATLHHRAATAALMSGAREQAIEHYLACRAAGWDDDALGFGATVLREEAQAALVRGEEAYAAERLPDAERAFRHALACVPADPVARNHLGIVLFRLGDHLGAARAWTEVLAAVVRGDLDAPEPVHLNLARAWKLAGEDAKAVDVLDAYLEREPEGEWRGETRAMIVRIESE